MLLTKQNTIDSNHKLSSNLVDDTNQTNKFITQGEKDQITTNKNNIALCALITETGNKIDLEINSSTYVLTAKLYDKNNNLLSTSNPIDLPLETMVVGASYDSTTQEIVLTLKNGTTVRFSVAALVSGLQTEITSDNKLASDLVDDTNSINKFVTTSDKTTWNGKQDALTPGNNINISNNVISATDTTYNDATTEISGLMSASDKTKLNGIANGAEVNVQSNWNESDANSDSYIQNKPDIPAALSDLSDDSTHRLVTDTEKSTWNSKYDKPNNGIPKTDLATDVQTSLGKADTALQTEQYTGTITSVKMNGTTIASSGEADLGTVITQHQDISGKEDTANKVTTLSSSSTDTQYPSAKCVYDHVDTIVGDINDLLDILNRTEV